MKAHILFGSTCEESKAYKDVLSPYDARVASQVAVCNADDALKALDIAKKSAPSAKKVPLHKRVSWLLDVAEKLKQNKEDMAKTMTDEVGK
ncbi:MAG: aldehyde dehydrogenase family protein, partial [Sulfurospirillaceae bacterium]|nr:aldehyde dehydrogenase family protein [Sulfurospirillaceae bacterium]